MIKKVSNLVMHRNFLRKIKNIMVKRGMLKKIIKKLISKINQSFHPEL
jgi:hypothetical protein